MTGHVVLLWSPIELQIMLNGYVWTLNLLLLEMNLVLSGPMRLGGSNNVDSVVLADSEKAVIIDTSTSFRGNSSATC